VYTENLTLGLRKNSIELPTRHYGKIRRCRAAYHCRAPLHGKDFFAVRSKQNARQRHYSRKSLGAAHGNEPNHGNDRLGARQRNFSRQSPKKAHGKET
jgi:hypothetical protein